MKQSLMTSVTYQPWALIRNCKQCFVLDFYKQNFLIELYLCSSIHVFELCPFQGEVNCVKWDPTGSLLASCSDDITAKVIHTIFLSLLNRHPSLHEIYIFV